MSKDSAISELYDLLMSNSPENSDCKQKLWSKDLQEISSEDSTKAHQSTQD